ncbi:MAG: tetratricopeptide repeat protein, partial [Bacteroidales bacterium]
MRLPNLFSISKGTRVVFIITLVICLSAILIAAAYYRGINRASDPRILPARELVSQAEEMTAGLQGMESVRLLDSALTLVRSVPGYAYSWEPGVIFNNISSAWLMMALYDSTLAPAKKEALLGAAGRFADSSLYLYRRWMDEWGTMPKEDVTQRIAPWFEPDDPSFAGLKPEQILNKRVREILSAQIETPRRISVTLTNRGTVHRHLNQPDSALLCFAEALELWDENRAARSNLKVLQGGEPL